MLAILLAFLAALGFGSGGIFIRLGLQQMKPSVGAFLSVVASFAVISTLALILNLDDILTLPLIALLWFFLLGIVDQSLGKLLIFAGLNLVGASPTISLLGSAPIFAIAFLGERPTSLTVIGTLAIIGGIALVVSE